MSLKAKSKPRKPKPASATAGDCAWVCFDLPGVKRIGEYLPNTKYLLPAAEAKRLVDSKGFTYTTPPGEQEN